MQTQCREDRWRRGREGEGEEEGERERSERSDIKEFF